VTPLLEEFGVETAGLVAFSGGSRHAIAAVAAHGSKISRVDIVSGAMAPGVSHETPPVQRLLSKLATQHPSYFEDYYEGKRGSRVVSTRPSSSVTCGLVLST
jgi:pimeloyl-ACP methyl ester carboxylesterase